MKTAVFAGTFDPFTLGHRDIAKRASALFERLIIGVAGVSSGGREKLELLKRVEIVKASTADLKNVEVSPFEGFLVDFARSRQASVLVRGLRTANDFEYEKALCEVYKQQDKNIECLYLISSHHFNHISGSVVRDLVTMGGDISGYVSENALELIKNSYRVR